MKFVDDQLRVSFFQVSELFQMPQWRMENFDADFNTDFQAGKKDFKRTIMILNQR